MPGPSSIDAVPPSARARVSALAARYPLGPVFAACGPIELLESLYVLDLLDRLVGPTGPDGRALDVGGKSAAYLPGLATFRGGGWDVVELDAHRRYWDLRTRRAVGEAMAGAFPGCRYHARDVRDHPGSYSLITWLLPFVFLEPHRAWGLPARAFDPAGTLRHVLSTMAPSGQLFIVNQGEEEHAEQGRLLRDAGAPARDVGVVESPLSPFRKRRLGWLVS